jgi:histidinol-phosphatase (PHP family)
VVLPADGHVHSEWSWDAVNGSMEQTCARAVAIGLPAVAFTEHADYTPWTVLGGGPSADQHLDSLAAPEESLTPPQLDLSSYLECLQRCREKFPGLHILSGVELGEPHWHSAVVARLLSAGQFDRVLGSLHCLPLGQHFPGPADLYQHPADRRQLTLRAFHIGGRSRDCRPGRTKRCERSGGLPAIAGRGVNSSDRWSTGI